MKRIYIPSVVVGAGVGTAYGPTLNLPTIFNINTQSLVYSPQQHSYIRAAHSNLQAAQLALDQSRQEVEEDTIATYLSLDYAQRMSSTLQEEFGHAVKLVSVIQDRVDAKLDSPLDLKRARRTALEIKLHQMQEEDDLASARQHLGDLTGVPLDNVTIVPESIPDIPAAASSEYEMNQSIAEGPTPESPGILAAEANAQAKKLQARGDAQYIWRPQINFGAQYGRISPLENVSQFYNINGQYNSASVGVQIQIPLLDRVRQASAHETAADAARAELELKDLRAAEEEGRSKLRRSIGELAIKSQLAELDYGIAQDELQSVLIQLHSPSGTQPLTPRGEERAHMEEREKYMALLNARRDLNNSAITYLRQSGQLENWLQSMHISLSNAKTNNRSTFVQ